MSSNGSTSTSGVPEGASTRPLPGARSALILLLSLNLFNYIDRYVLASTLPKIEEEMFSGPLAPCIVGLGASPWGQGPFVVAGALEEEKLLIYSAQHSGTKMGSLTTAFFVTYMVMSPFFGYLADRMRRWFLIGVAIALWSLASGASGLATTFAILFLTRCLVGVGEAAYGPSAPTLIADFYPVKIRGSIFAWFYSAIPVGSALGFALGGQVAASLNWRWAFYLVVPPGLLLGFFCFLMKEPVRGQAEIGTPRSKSPRKISDYLVLLKTPSFVLDTLGMTAMTFAMGGLAVWMPTYLEEVHAPSMGPVDAKTVFGGILALAGLLATLIGGIVGDKLQPMIRGSYFLVSGATMILGFPLVLALVWQPTFPLFWLILFFTVFCGFLNTGPTNTILANVTPPSIRASAFAINIFIIHILGDVISPPIIGVIKDQTHGLFTGFVLVALMMLVSGALWIWGALYLDRDTRLAPTRLEENESAGPIPEF